MSIVVNVPLLIIGLAFATMGILWVLLPWAIRRRPVRYVVGPTDTLGRIVVVGESTSLAEIRQRFPDHFVYAMRWGLSARLED